MKASVTKSAVSAVYLCNVLFILFSVNVGSRYAESQVCQMCEGTVRKESPVWDFCLTKGQIRNHCCFKNNSSKNSIIGLDLSNCNISHIEQLYDASTAVIIDLSNNPVSNLSDFVFQGFSDLAQLIVPSKLDCPGGNASWEKVEVRNNSRVCEGQKNVCNQTSQMSWNCPENSFCRPYGPGFFECSCIYNFYGYKCLRKGEFPTLKVLAILSASTVVVSGVLWFTQRRKVKAT